MDQTTGSTSFTLFGTRVDCAAPVHTTPMIWESAISRGGMCVVLADMWTLLMAQRDYAMWEALSAAEFVLPLGDDPIIRRAAARQHLPVTHADGLLFDLFDAAAGSRKHVVIVAPSAERDTDLAIMRQVWPELQVTGMLPGEVEDSPGDRELVRAVNVLGPELLVLGGGSPWQEAWSHAYRDDLEIGAVVLLPTLHPALAAIAQRAGQPIAGIKLLRRKAAIRRAISTTIGPVASASAETVGAWLQEAREGLADWSATLSSLRRPSPPGQLALPAPGNRTVGTRARAGRAANESNGHWVGISPLARLGPPRQGAGVGLPPAAPGHEQTPVTQQGLDGPTSEPGHAPERPADQTPHQVPSASGPWSRASAAEASGVDNGWRPHTLEPTELLAAPDASLRSTVPEDRAYWAEQPTTALTLDQLSAAARAPREPNAASKGDDGVPPPASSRPGADDATRGTQDEQSPLDEGSYDDEHMLVFEAHSPVDWSAFLEAEQGYDQLPPTTKLDPRAVRELGRRLPGGVPADMAPTQLLRSPEPGEPDASSRSSIDANLPTTARQASEANGDAAPAAPGAGRSAEAKGSPHVEPMKGRIVSKYVLRRSHRRVARERRYHRRLKPRQQGA